MNRRRTVAMVLLLALATCRREDMFVQQRAVAWGAFFSLRQHVTMQIPVAGTIARDAPDAPVAQPQKITRKCCRGASSSSTSIARLVTGGPATARA